MGDNRRGPFRSTIPDGIHPGRLWVTQDPMESYVPADAYFGDIAGTGHTPYDWDGDNDLFWQDCGSMRWILFS